MRSLGTSTLLTLTASLALVGGLLGTLPSCGSDDDCGCASGGGAGAGGATGGVGGDDGGAGSTAGGSSGGGRGGSSGGGAAGEPAGGSGGNAEGGSGGSGGAPGGAGGSSAGAAGSAPHHEGDGTFYDADGSGNCSFDPSPGDLMVAAMNDVDYADSLVCGGCIQVEGPDGSVTVRIVDRCPECPEGDVDLSAEAFAQIADPVDGRVSIEWYDVACDVTGPIVYRFKEGSSQWWTAIQVRNTRWAVASLEVKVGGVYESIPRESYNYFVYAAGLGVGPYETRVTDVRGHVLEDTGIALGDGTEVAGSAQFPP